MSVTLPPLCSLLFSRLVQTISCTHVVCRTSFLVLTCLFSRSWGGEREGVPPRKNIFLDTRLAFIARSFRSIQKIFLIFLAFLHFIASVNSPLWEEIYFSYFFFSFLSFFLLAFTTFNFVEIKYSDDIQLTSKILYIGFHVIFL